MAIRAGRFSFEEFNRLGIILPRLRGEDDLKIANAYWASLAAVKPRLALAFIRRVGNYYAVISALKDFNGPYFQWLAANWDR